MGISQKCNKNSRQTKRNKIWHAAHQRRAASWGLLKRHWLFFPLWMDLPNCIRRCNPFKVDSTITSPLEFRRYILDISSRLGSLLYFLLAHLIWFHMIIRGQLQTEWWINYFRAWVSSCRNDFNTVCASRSNSFDQYLFLVIDQLNAD